MTTRTADASPNVYARLAILLLPNYEETPIYFAIPIAAAEMLFPLWLLIKGVDVEQWEERALESA